LSSLNVPRALLEMRSQKARSCGAHEVDPSLLNKNHPEIASFEEAIRNLPETTSFEEAINVYCDRDEELKTTRRKFKGCRPSDPPLYSLKLPGNVAETLNRYYVWRHPDVVEAIQMFENTTVEVR